MIDTSASKIRDSFKNDPGRPIYHFLPPSNWMNDPNGLIQWKGQYHLFYQYNPQGAFHATMNWGHAVSDDLIHWTDLPIALSPTPHSVDEGGIFSGCTVNNAGIATIFYTGVSHDYEIQLQCMATSRDDLLTWQKHPDNPVIGKVPAEAKQSSEFRDPFVWRDADRWYMLVGSQIVDKGGVVFLYQSDDLLQWDYLHPLYIAEDEHFGVVWECPNFFKLGDKWVLIVSCNSNDITGDVIYFVGNYENQRFIPEKQGVLDYAYLYAPLTIEDDKKRRLLWGWIREGRSESAHNAAGWAGVQSIPRVLALDEHNNLLMQPVPELESIRGRGHQFIDLSLSDEFAIEASGLALDIEARFIVSGDSVIRFEVACSADKRVGTEIRYDASTQRLMINREKSSTDMANDRRSHIIEHQLYDGESLDLRILLDGSVIEVIANKRTSITSRIYPTQFEDKHVIVTGNKAHIAALNIYEMPSIWSSVTS